MLEDNRIIVSNEIRPQTLSVVNDSTMTDNIIAQNIIYDLNFDSLYTVTDTLSFTEEFDFHKFQGEVFNPTFVKKYSNGYYALVDCFKSLQTGIDIERDNYLVMLDNNFKIKHIQRILKDEINLENWMLVETGDDNILVSYDNMDYPTHIHDSTTYLLLDTNLNFISKIKTQFAGYSYTGNYLTIRKIGNQFQRFLLPFSGGPITTGANLYIRKINPVDYSFTTKTIHFKNIRGYFDEEAYYPSEIPRTVKIILKDKSVVFDLNYTDSLHNHLYTWAKIDSNGNSDNLNITGNVYGDKNSNCSHDAGDIALKNFGVMATNATDTFYTTTDSAGSYKLYTDHGAFTVSVRPNPLYPQWDPNACSPSKPAVFTDNTIIIANFFVFEVVSTNVLNKYAGVELSVQPNPFHDKAELIIKNVKLQQPQLLLYTVDGKLVKKYSAFNGNSISIQRNDLASGFYIYRLTDQDEEIATGKINIQ